MTTAATASAHPTGRRHVRPPEVLHVGAACRDVSETDPRGWRLGGGVTYAALATARLGLRTAAVVGVDAAAASAPELDLLRAAGVDLLLVPLDEGPVFHNLELPTGRVQTCVAAGQGLPVVPVPESWLHAAAWSIAPVAGEVDEAWAGLVPDGAYLGVGWQGFLRHLAAGERVGRRPPSPHALIARADLVGVSHHDLDPETPLAALYPMLRPGAVLIVTQGHEGGVAVTLGADRMPVRRVRYRADRADREVDPTGAGDTFLAALLSTAVRRALAGRPPSRRLDLPFASAAASLAVEDHGLDAVPDRAAVLVRMARERVERIVRPSRADRVGSYEHR
jgi:sugar/nucleoside kinase (ribokinase family)